jgi:YD repeat-containing protein
VRQLCVALGIVCMSLEISAHNVVTVSDGSTYSYLTNSTGQITSITNDDGSGVAFEYDSAGTEVGTSVQAGPMWLTVRHMVVGNISYVAAMGLPALQINHDALGRTIDITADPNIHIDEGGEITFETSNLSWLAPHSWTAASFTYDSTGRLTSTTLSDGLLLQLGVPDAAGMVHQTLYGAQGNTIAEASAVGAARGVRIVPAHLDAVAAGLGLGHQWAESLTFETTASGYLTTAFDANHLPVLYLVDVGPYRVGFSTDGTPLFYDVQPSYESISEASGVEPSPLLAGVAPNHIVIAADGRTGLYLDHPADSALYSAWTELDTSGNTVQPFAVLEPSSSSSLEITTNGNRRSSSHPHLIAMP